MANIKRESLNMRFDANKHLFKAKRSMAGMRGDQGGVPVMEIFKKENITAYST